MSNHPSSALVEVLLQIPALSDANVRSRLVELTGRALRRGLDPRRASEAAPDLLAIVDSCAAVSGGLLTLARTTGAEHPGPAAARAAELARELQGGRLLSDPDRRELIGMLEGADPASVFTALGELGEVPELK